MNSKTAIVVIALTLSLAGCGNKGPLVLAEAPPPIVQPATAPGEVPVEIAPETTVPDASIDPGTEPLAPPVDDDGG